MELKPGFSGSIKISIEEYYVKRFLGISLAIFGIALAAVPFFTDCASQGHFMTSATGIQMPMRCYGNRIPELAIGAGLFGVGMVTSFFKFKSKVPFFSLSILAVLLGGAGILMPTSFIGTCPNPVMFCNAVMKPSIITVGSLGIIGGLAGLVLTRRIKL
jgi:hypothetical protein